MAETKEFKDFLKGLFKDFITNEAKNYLSDLHAFRIDSNTGDYRTTEELATIETNIRTKAEQMSSDFLNELDVEGISTPEDYEKKADVLEKILLGYRDKLLNWLREQ